MTGHEAGSTARDHRLRSRLAGLDPARPGGPAFSPGPSEDDLRELIMATTDRPTTAAPASTPDAGGERGRPRRTAWLAAAAALVLVAVGIGGALTLGGDDPASPPRPLALTVPGGDGAATSSCVMFDVAILREMPVALAGTVTAVTDDKVTLSVDRWYQGTAAQRQAEVVTLAVPGGSSSVALDGIELVHGERYLLAATDGAVNGCGFSGPAGPELEAAYAEAFGG